jgi:hypothetical protein
VKFGLLAGRPPLRPPHAVEDAIEQAVEQQIAHRNCPGQKPPFWDVTRPARPHKNADKTNLPRVLKLVKCRSLTRAHNHPGRERTEYDGDIDCGGQRAVQGHDSRVVFHPPRAADLAKG